MPHFNRQRAKSEARSEIQAEIPGLTAGGATSSLSTHGRWLFTPSATTPGLRPPSAHRLHNRTHQGGAAYARTPKMELFLLAVANMVGHHTFYEDAAARDERYEQLVRTLAVSDPEWTLGLLGWLRTEAHMRTASLVGAAEFVRARLEAGAVGFSRQAVSVVLQRADEPGELLAYWTSRHGRGIPQPLKRGIADAARRLYTGRALLKYDTASRPYRFGDVVELTHPSPDPRRPWQGDLFKYAIDRRHHPDRALPPSGETLLAAHRELLAVPVEERRALVTAPGGDERLSAAGMTWESVAGWLQGPLDAAVWEALIPSMGAMALVRNLRNLDQAGVSDRVAAEVAARISCPDEVRRSRQFPFRYLAAHRNAPSRRWEKALETALGHSLANVPELPGRTLILVDRSGSMFDQPSERTQLNRADSAAIFGTALAQRAARADLVEFGSDSRRVELVPGEPVLRVLDRFHDLGGTNTALALRRHYDRHDRVVVVTDEQAGPSQWSNPLQAIPLRVPVYTWNLAGYAPAHAPSGPHHHTFGGLSDAAFRLIPLIEAGRDSEWPWETAS
ncbi:TROVE domain-containing protein [Streptomyces stelliscabiei]|uniref:TROVE domain-containing protein n=1 Tax=Streptomyces stelliscabiei TaxID=146820 RepID=UPI0029B318CF|nr:TROVE domain-containing protein [Streptomyces stelliscabiei]MDX2550598.1 TROVE domain-containing protein [Streptomyces stelliscabiei]MDX2610296.1 TROVE domain-containing protein [Streptomyces stelliscabiei]MDX2634783.1 TROVE domain-containing protein [Streptomyces stelliscabiei]MDX2659729.1 TROVE domain-containing protein [Streptomyces stelliscabiei]MDX2715200.1 TROVE domain-containing protein [Streptomyces stelliscabiei]